MPKENGPFFATVMLTGAAFATDMTSLYTWLDGRCAGGSVPGGDHSCGWCGDASAVPGNCQSDYAGCKPYSYVATAGTMLKDSNGEVLQYIDGNTITQYRCTNNGWAAVTSSVVVEPEETCNRYTYHDDAVGGCVLCPEANVFMSADLSPDSMVLVKGDNYQQLLTGCHYGFSEGQPYYDDTGAFVFMQTGACYHDGIL